MRNFNSTNITLLLCGEVSSNALFSYIQYLPDNVSKDIHTLSSAFIPGAHKDTFSHCLRCGMSCLLCLSNNSLTMFSHPKGNGCCLTQTFSCWFNNSLERMASSRTIGLRWQRLKVALFIIFAWDPEKPGSLQSTPVSLFYQLPRQHCLQGHRTRLGWHKEDMWTTNVLFLETAQYKPTGQAFASTTLSPVSYYLIAFYLPISAFHRLPISPSQGALMSLLVGSH